MSRKHKKKSRNQQQEQTIVRKAITQLSDATILMIEDDPMLRELYTRVFSRENVNIQIANDGEEGLAKIKSLKPDIVLLDVMLPRLNGIEILEEIQADGSISNNMPVIMLTDLDQPGVEVRARELGAKDFLSKNAIDGATLIRRVKDELKIN